MRRALIVTLMLIVTASVIASDKKDGAQGNKAGLEQAAKLFFDAVKASDTAKIKSYYTPDYTFTGPDGKMMSGDERLKLMAAGSLPAVISYSDMNVRTYGSTGVVTGIAMTKNSAGATEQGRFTQAWTWQKDRWWLAASHVSRISP
jgi:ketosteroid isomerase-like protein